MVRFAEAVSLGLVTFYFVKAEVSCSLRVDFGCDSMGIKMDVC